MNVIFNWSRSTVSARGQLDCERLAKSSLKDFFRHKEVTGLVSLMIFKLSPGGSTINKLKAVPRSQDFGRNPTGFPVMITTEGSKAITCLMSVEGLQEEEVRDLVLGGPYFRKQKIVSTPYEEDIVRQESDATTSSENSTSQDAVPVTSSEDRTSIDSELLRSGLPQHDLECLRAFYLELSETFFGGAKEGTVFVKNKSISSLMGQAFGLRHTLGAFGAVYSSRIRPFAKSEVRENIRGWSFSVTKVMAFTDGARIPKMAHPHPNTINLPPHLVYKAQSSTDLHEAERAPPFPLDDKPITVVLTTQDLLEVTQVSVPMSADWLVAAMALMESRSARLQELLCVEQEKQELLARLKALEEDIFLNAKKLAKAEEAVKETEISEELMLTYALHKKRHEEERMKLEAFEKLFVVSSPQIPVHKVA